ncbi:MAG: hypothetical protein LBC80_04085, partial [Treponema sp.]|nr:hypothetical protein [Treponema sp.]
MKKPVKFFLAASFVVFVILAFAACELLVGIPKSDLMDKIDEDIARARADRVIVSVDYPPEWGSSPQYGVDNAGDVRVNFPFDVDFTPLPDFALLRWEAHNTEDLDPIWLSNPTLHLRNPITNVLLPQVRQDRGQGRVTLFNSNPVTLVPFSRAQPRIVRSTPNEDTTFYGRARPITVTFAAPLDPKRPEGSPEGETVLNTFTLEGIRIFMRMIDENTGEPVNEAWEPIDGFHNSLKLYEDPEFDSNILTIIPIGSGPPASAEIMLVLGRDITTRAFPNSRWEPVIFTWRTWRNNFFVNSWEATYNNDGYVELEWVQEGNAEAEVVWRRPGSNSELPPLGRSGLLAPGTTSFNVPLQGPFTGDNGEGLQIWIHLYVDGEDSLMEDINSIIIYNDDRIKVTSARPARAITNSEDFSRMMMGNSNRIYILDRDIDVVGAWTSVGNEANPFMGTFYGMGKTVKFLGGSAFTTARHFGVFGYLDGARIHDLIVEYEGFPTVHNTVEIFVGGIAGFATGSSQPTRIEDSTVRNGGIISRATSHITMGGIVGHMEGNVYIENCTAALNLTIDKNTSGDITIGAVAGHNVSSLPISIRDNNVAGNITVTSNSDGEIHAGGVIGRQTTTAVLQGINYSGNVTINKTGGTGPVFAGGITGAFSSSVNFNNLKFTGNINVNSSSSVLNAGGIAGGSLSLASGSIQNPVFEGNINVGSSGSPVSGDIRVGGLAGFLNGTNATTSRISLVGANTTDGTITVFGSNRVHAGGIVGIASNFLFFNNCKSQANIEVSASGPLYAGGFAGEFSNSGITITGSTNVSNLTVRGTSTEIHAGGFAGRSNANVFEISSSGEVIAEDVSGGILNIGGLFGSTTANIADSSSSTDIIVKDNINSVLNAGGLAGLAADSSSVERSNVTGNVETRSSAVQNVGGLIGRSFATIIDSSAAGNLDTYSSAELNVGGLVGHSSGNITKGRYLTGQIKVNSSGILRAGGLAGYASAGTITGSRAAADLDAAGSGSGPHYAGGLVGHAAGTITLSRVTKNVKMSGTGTIYAGGLAGYVTGLVERSWADVKLLVEPQSSAAVVRAGGLAGDLFGGTIQNTYTFGETEIDYLSGSANLAAGGLAGEINGANARINKSFAGSEVFIKSGTTGTARVGGIVGTGSSGSVSQTVMLGENVAVTADAGASEDNVTAFRIGHNTGTLTFQNNFARNDLVRVGRSKGGYSSVTNRIIPRETGADTPHGGNVTVSELRQESVKFWENPPMEFSPQFWRFDTETIRSGGHPLLLEAGETFQDADPVHLPYNITRDPKSGQMVGGSFVVNANPDRNNNLELGHAGSTYYVKVTLNDGFNVGSVIVTETSNAAVTVIPVTGDNLNQYQFKMPHSNVTVRVNFGKIPYRITPETGGGGTITYVAVNGVPVNAPSNSVLEATVDDMVSFMVTPFPGFRLAENGVKVITPTRTTSLTPGAGGIYTFDMPADDIVLEVTFLVLHRIRTVFDPQEGKIEILDGLERAAKDDDVYFTVTAEHPNFRFIPEPTVILDAGGSGPSVTLVGQEQRIYTYTFRMPDGDVTIGANFEPLFKIRLPENVVGGEIQITKPAGLEKIEIQGEDVEFTVTPDVDPRYRINKVTVNENVYSVHAQSGNTYTYTFRMPGRDAEIDVEFARLYTITPTIIPGKGSGSITNITVLQPPNDPTMAAENDDVEFEVENNSGWRLQLEGVSVDGGVGVLEPDGSEVYRFNMPDGDVSITAAFERTFLITTETPTPVRGGSFELKTDRDETVVAGNSAVAAENGEISILLEADNGYSVGVVSVVRTSDGATTVYESFAGNTHTFTMPGYDVTVKVTFVPDLQDIGWGQLPDNG